MIDSLAINLLATGIASATTAKRKHIRSELRKERYSRALGDIETEFNDTFKTALQEAAKDGSNALYNIAIHWDLTTIAEQLDDIDLLFEDEAEAVARIVDTIESDPDVELTDTSHEETERAVAIAYRSSVDKFYSRVAGTDLADELQLEIDADILTTVREVSDRIKNLEQQLTPRRKYWFLNFPEQRDRAVELLLGEQRPSYVPRPEVKTASFETGMLVTGPVGSGKTRALGGMLEDLDANSISHVIVPKQDLNYPGDGEGLATERYTGDVLLVWDDIHRINEERDNRVFEEVVDTLQVVLEENGHNLMVLFTARSGNLGDVPGDVSNQQGRWQEIEICRLEKLDHTALKQIMQHLADLHRVSVHSSIESKLIERAEGDSAPLYIEAAIKLASSSTLTEAEVEELPNTVKGIWQSQYDLLQEENDSGLAVLEACKLLFDLHMVRSSSLVRGIFVEVLGGGKRTYRRAVEDLENRQWISETQRDGLFQDDSIFQCHDVQLEAVEQHVADFLVEMSDFFSTEMESYLQELTTRHQTRTIAALNVAFGLMVDKTESSLSTEYTHRHFERAIEIDSNPSWRFQYGQWLENQGEFETAADQYRTAIDEDEPHSPSHTALAILLYQGRINYDAGNSIERAVEELRAAVRIDPANSYAISTLANVMKKLGNFEQAERLYKKSIKAYSESRRGPWLESPEITDAPKDTVWPVPHLNYALFLFNSGRGDEAVTQFEHALELKPNSGLILSQFGPILMKLGDYEQAESRLLDALEHLDDDYMEVITHFHLSSLYYQMEYQYRAHKHLAILRSEYPDQAQKLESKIEAHLDV